MKNHKANKSVGSKHSSAAKEAPQKTARPGATRDPAIKPKVVSQGKPEVFRAGSSGKTKKTAEPTHSFGENYIPGRMCPNLCNDKSCQQLIEKAGYCRLFYIKNWGTIQRKKEILAGGQLTRYIEEIVQKYPEKYLEAVRLDLAHHDAFQKVVIALELDADADTAANEEEDFGEVLESIKPAIDDESFE